MYVPRIRNIISSYHVVFDKNFSSALAYTSQPYSEAMAMRPYMKYTPCTISSREKTGYIITFAKFEEGNLLSETREDVENNDESSEESDDDSIMPPLLSV